MWRTQPSGDRSHANSVFFGGQIFLPSLLSTCEDQLFDLLLLLASMHYLLLAAAAGVASAGILFDLQPVEQHHDAIVARGLSSWGGFALLSATCPSETSSCGNVGCCPATYTCNTNIGAAEPVCCPSSMNVPDFPLGHRRHVLAAG